MSDASRGLAVPETQTEVGAMRLKMLLLTAGATTLLWFVPSIGTQGMGTIGARVAHPDAALLDTVPARRNAARASLARADRLAEAALPL